MYRTFAASGTDRTGAGHAGSDSLTVRPIRPVKVVPGLYSRNAISSLPAALKDRRGRRRSAYARAEQVLAASNTPKTKRASATQWTSAAGFIRSRWVRE